MKKIVLVLMCIFASPTWAGSLFSFDKNQVLFAALQQIKLRHSDLAKMELKSGSINPYLDRKGNLYAVASFSYTGKGLNNTLFVCVSLDENGNVLNLERDIESIKGPGNFPVSKNLGCYVTKK